MPIMETTDTPTTPNAARVYDYMLGGDHNFEPDRQAAAYMISLVPSTPKWVRKLRRFLHQAVQQLASEGFEHFLDLASGLPTKEHIHSSVPGSHVVYVDNDPLVVSTGTRLLDGAPTVRYLEADIRSIESLLEQPAVQELRARNQKTAIGLNAATCFLTGEEIRKLAEALYDWAPEGSKLFATFETKAPELMTAKMQQFLDMFDQMGSPYHFLTLEESRSLISPWKLDGTELRPIADWLTSEEHATPEEREGVELEFYGAILRK